MAIDNVINFPKREKMLPNVDMNSLDDRQLKEIRFHLNGHLWVHESKFLSKYEFCLLMGISFVLGGLFVGLFSLFFG